MGLNSCSTCNHHSLGGYCIYFDFKTKDTNPACLEYCPLDPDPEKMKK